MLPQDRCHVVGFDTEAADLQLPVAAAEEPQVPGAVPARKVTGSVQGMADVRAEFPESFGCLRGHPSVSPGQAVAIGIQLPDAARRNQMPSMVEHQYAGAADRPTDGQRADLRRCRVVHVKGCCERGVLGWPVPVGDSKARTGAQDSGHLLRRYYVAPGQHLDDLAECVWAVVGCQAEQACGQPEPCDGPLGQERGQRIGRYVGAREDLDGPAS